MALIHMLQPIHCFTEKFQSNSWASWLPVLWREKIAGKGLMVKDNFVSGTVIVSDTASLRVLAVLRRKGYFHLLVFVYF